MKDSLEKQGLSQKCESQPGRVAGRRTLFDEALDDACRAGRRELTRKIRASGCYQSWNSLIQRNRHRGLELCERWFDFWNFYDDMGSRPAGGSLCRRDATEGAGPENCFWHVPSEGAIRPTKRDRVLYHGEKVSHRKLAELLAIDKQHLYRYEWAKDKVVTENDVLCLGCLQESRMKIDDVTFTLAQWSDYWGVHTSIIRRLLYSGMTPSDIRDKLKRGVCTTS